MKHSLSKVQSQQSLTLASKDCIWRNQRNACCREAKSWSILKFEVKAVLFRGKSLEWASKDLGLLYVCRSRFLNSKFRDESLWGSSSLGLGFKGHVVRYRRPVKNATSSWNIGFIWQQTLENKVFIKKINVCVQQVFIEHLLWAKSVLSTALISK